jgi:hypothetical protein
MPSAWPRSLSGKERLKMAKEVPKIIAAPIPVKKRAVVRIIELGDREARSAEMKYT